MGTTNQGRATLAAGATVTTWTGETGTVVTVRGADVHVRLQGETRIDIWQAFQLTATTSQVEAVAS